MHVTAHQTHVVTLGMFFCRLFTVARMCKRRGAELRNVDAPCVSLFVVMIASAHAKTCRSKFMKCGLMYEVVGNFFA